MAFTGSVRSGKAVATQCAGTLTPMLLELGGKDPAIVSEDADLDEAAAHIVWGLQNAGQGCISLEVAYVVDRYVQPTVLVGVPVDALAVTEETIGPTLAIVRVADVEEGTRSLFSSASPAMP